MGSILTKEFEIAVSGGTMGDLEAAQNLNETIENNINTGGLSGITSFSMGI